MKNDHTTDLGRGLTVTEVQQPQQRYRPSIQHAEKIKSEELGIYLELHFDIEYSARWDYIGDGSREILVEDMRATLTEAEAYCDKQGATIQLERSWREKMERWFQNRLDGCQRDSIKAKCEADWESCN